MSSLIPVLVILVMVLLNALYVAAEFATVGARRSRVQDLAASGKQSAAILSRILHDPHQLDEYVAACQVGITLSSLVAGAYGQAQLAPVFESLFGRGGRVAAIIVVLLLVTALQVVLGELLPKTVALRYPERLALLVLMPMRISRWLFRPLVVVFNGSAFALMRAFRLTVDHGHAHVHSPEELAGLYRASAEGGLIDAAEREMLAGVLNVESRMVREIMTPRRRLTTVAESMTVEEALSTLAESPHSRFPVTSEDEVTGIVHLRDLFIQSQVDPTVQIASLTRPVVGVAETLTVPELWRELSEESQHCALVVTEYGWVAGMVTLEDAIEEIFGEVNDEFDLYDDPVIIDAGRVSVRGDVLLSLLNDRFDFRLPVDIVDTVGGLIWHLLGRLPAVGDEVAAGPDGPMLRVDVVDGRAIDRASFVLPESGR